MRPEVHAPTRSSDNQFGDGGASPLVIGAENPCGDLRDPGIRAAPLHWIPDHVRNDERRLAAQAGYLRSSVIGVVPRGRIELPTHGFSVHCSTD